MTRDARDDGRTETLEEKIARVVKEHVVVVPYDPAWPERFERERDHLLSCLPEDLVKRIEHFGSTAVPGLAAKPVVDVLVEVTSLEETRKRIAPVLEAQGYDYFWRPSGADGAPPFHAWFIKRDEHGNRTHHIHMVEGHFEHWDRLLFRDYLIEHPAVAREYARLKVELSGIHAGDRIAYTAAKTDFIQAVTERAKRSRPAGGGRERAPVPDEASASSWSVWREDENGNRFEVSRGHGREEALRLVERYEAGGHKQRYWAAPSK